MWTTFVRSLSKFENMLSPIKGYLRYKTIFCYKVAFDK